MLGQRGQSRQVRSLSVDGGEAKNLFHARIVVLFGLKQRPGLVKEQSERHAAECCQQSELPAVRV